MRTSRSYIVVAAALCITWGVAGSSAQSPVMRSVMQRKLDDAQGLLKPVVVSDFAQVDRVAERLSRITDMEVASWQTPGQPEYTRQAVLFLTSVQGLREAARRRDASAMGDQYAALVSSCVHCHAVLRRSRLISTK